MEKVITVTVSKGESHRRLAGYVPKSWMGHLQGDIGGFRTAEPGAYGDSHRQLDWI